MKPVVAFLAVSVVLPALCYPDSSATAHRDEALKKVEACLQTKQISNSKCRHLDKSLGVLISAYRVGDKSVLPWLLHFTHLTDFYGEALLGDPNGFLAAVSQLPGQNQSDVAAGLAGTVYGLSQPRFLAIRAALSTVPDSSPNFSVARLCLQALETQNAWFFVKYFPPDAFTGPSGTSKVYWFSREMYALGEKPLWPSQAGTALYRITVLPAFSGPESVTLKVLADGSAETVFRDADARTHEVISESKRTISSQQLADFQDQLDRMQFMEMPVEAPNLGMDGGEWIFEAVQDGRYKVVNRWCPGNSPFGGAARRLFELAGRKLGGC